MKWKAPRYGTQKRCDCRKCGVNTDKIDEYYVVHDELWQSVIDRWKIPLDEHGESGMICIRCSESLLGRKLTKQDFRKCPANELGGRGNKFSKRLYDRLTTEAANA